MRATLLQQFPGLRHRVEATDHGEGTLAVQRWAFGVELAFVRPRRALALPAMTFVAAGAGR
jgi:hypothetical protein